MRKKIVLFCILTFSMNVYSQEKDYYNNLVDSLLIILGQQIENDLALDGFNVPRQTSYDVQLVGSSMILEIYFTPKCSYILTMFGTTKSMYNKFFKQTKGFHFRKRFYFEAFLRYTQENNKLPIEYLTYKFITPYDNSPKEHAIYGEYKFKLNENEKYEIIGKKLEILENEDAISKKYRSTF